MNQSVDSPSARPETRTSPHDENCCETTHEHGLETTDLLRIGLVLIAAIAVWFHVWEPIPQVSVIGLVATIVGGYPIFREALENILERRMTMELSMSIALIAALVVREFFTALVIALFVLVAEVLEGLTVGRGRHAIRTLLDFLPPTASFVSEGQTREVPITSVHPGDTVVVRPGGRVPVDGTVVNGNSFVDQSSITGESMPAEKSPGKEVYAGTINQSGALLIRVERLGRDTSFGKIIEAVEQADRSRAPIQKTADRLAGYLVYFALSAALLNFIVTRNARSTISVIIVAGACGIAAGTPLAILGGIGRAAKHGSIIKGGLFLEKLATIDTVVLDKTGTLTYGTPEVVEVKSADGWPAQVVLKTAAVAELRSEHPVGKAIVNRCISRSIDVAEPDNFTYLPGRGVIARSDGVEIVVGNQALLAERGVQIEAGANHNHSAVFVSQNGKLVGSIVIADQVRPEAAAAMRALAAMGIDTALLTGDSKAVAQDVAQALNVTNVFSELLPEEKLQHIRTLVKSGRRVAMVGDGINDAPALAEATVGVAMGSGTDVARESADIVLIGNDLSKFVETVQIARKCRAIIMQNFYGTLMVDTVGVGLAAVGLLNPLLAAFIHVSSELTFILNSTRLLPSSKEPAIVRNVGGDAAPASPVQLSH
jgi:heavy metal translocating P-type ATPase